MFGLFQSDLPIGNRLWYALLALVIAGTIADSPLATASSDPVTFVTDVLLLFGQASFISGIFTTLFQIGFILVEARDRASAAEKQNAFFGATEDYNPFSTRAVPFVSLVFFVIAVIWTTDDHFYHGLGILGLLGFLLGEFTEEFLDVRAKGSELLELKCSQPEGVIYVRLLKDNKEERFTLQLDCLDILAYLLNNSWEVVSLAQHVGTITTPENNTSQLCSALFRRDYSRSFLSPERLGNAILRLIK